MTIFGPIITDTRVENAVRRSLMGWLPVYIPAVTAADDDTSPVVLPKSFGVSRSGVDRWPEQALPAVVVQVSGTLDVTLHAGGYRAVYGCGVGAVVGSNTFDNTRRIAGIYSMAIVLALTQHGELDGLASGVGWHGTDYDLISNDQSRTLMAAVVSLSVAVDSVADPRQGPTGDTPAVPEDYPPDWGVVETVIVDERIVPVDETLT